MDNTPPVFFENRIDLNDLNQSIEEVKNEISKIIVGQQQFINLLIIALIADGHVLIEGVPGVAKTLTAKLLAKTLNTKFSRIQFTPDLMPSDVLGTSIFNIKTSDFEFKAGPIFANIVLIDEINRSPAKTQAALFEVMEERQVTIDGHKHEFSTPFMVLATQNPIEHEGTYRLPEAQLDRFLFKIEINYPNETEEIQLLNNFNQQKYEQHNLDKINIVLTPAQLQNIKNKVKNIYVEPNLINYICKIVQLTRNHKDLYLGASPRASLGILNACKAMAATQGRDFVTPEDIRFVALPTLRHRIILSPEKEMEGGSPNEIIQQILQLVEVPR